MAQDSAQHQRFVSRVHRRMIALSILEWAGRYLLVTSLLTIFFLAVAIWYGKALVDVVTTMLIGWTLVGAFAGWVARPKRIQASQEADRQLHLDDLLTTAHLTPRGSIFADAIHVMADARVARLHPRQVILNKFGFRGWAGIGLSAALVVALTMLSANPVPSHATTSRHIARNQSPDSRQPSAIQRHGSGSNQLPQNLTPDQSVEAADPHGGHDSTTTSSNNGRGQDGSDQRTTSSNGTTGGVGQSNDGSNNNPFRPTPGGARIQGTADQTAGGTGATSATTAARGSSSNVAGQPARQRSAPAWTTDTWPQSQQAAEQAIRSGHVPPAYQDLVRAYFAR